MNTSAMLSRPKQPSASKGPNHWAVNASLALALLFLPLSAWSDLWLPPARQLTRQDRLSHSVAWADVICRGTIVGVVDTLEHRPGESGDLLAHDRLLTVKVLDWIKGSVPGETLRVGTWSDDSPVWKRYRWPDAAGAQAIFFLRPAPGRTDNPGIDRRWPYPERAQWIFEAGPYALDDGLTATTDSDAVELRKEVADEIANQTVDSLSAHSELVVVAHRAAHAQAGHVPSHPYGFQMAIDSTLAGTSPDGVITVATVLPGEIPANGALLFLRKTQDNTYETILPTAAVDEVRAGWLVRFREQLSVVAAKVRTAHARRVP